MLASEVIINVAHERLRLRPTLWAATRLEREWGGFDKLIDALDSGSATAMESIIRESAPESDFSRLEVAFNSMPFETHLDRLIEPLKTHVLNLVGVDPAEGDPNAERVPFPEHFARLFAIGTGWLSWTPDETWASSPAEIIAAFQCRQDMLRAIFGGEEPKKFGPKHSAHVVARLKRNLALYKANREDDAIG